MKIKRYTYEKVEIDSKDFELPTEPCYFFETGIRRSIRIIPCYTTRNKELYEFQITCVYLSFECKIEQFIISLDRIENYYYKETNKFNNFVTSWIDDHFNKRTKEQFENDLNIAIKSITTL